VTALLEKYVARLAAADRNTRLETLLDLSRKLPPLPPALAVTHTRDAHRVPECQTPVHLWVEVTGGVVRLHAEVPRESPTPPRLKWPRSPTTFSMPSASTTRSA
jgi:cysteine desulfuration protein SufE